MKATILKIKRGSKTGRILDVSLEYLENAESNYLNGHSYERQINGKQVKIELIDKKDYKKYDALSKELEVVYIGNYRQRVYTDYLFETCE